MQGLDYSIKKHHDTKERYEQWSPLKEEAAWALVNGDLQEYARWMHEARKIEQE